MLLALGTFVAGVHIAWQICVLGLIMALAVPAIAWLTSYALFLTLVGAALVGIAATFMWRHSDEDTSKVHAREETSD
jgi:membrane protein implicated in regulation of membrane protease activity